MFIVGLLLVMGGILILATRKRLADHWIDSDRTIVMVVASLAFAALGIGVVIVDSYTIVPARNVGIVNTSGKAEGALDNGFLKGIDP